MRLTDMDLNRRSFLRGGAAVGAGGVVGAAASGGATADVSRSADWGDQDTDPEPYEDYETHRVAADGSADYEEIQEAVTAASSEDLVLVEPGVYNEEVKNNDTPRLTIRGTDRANVILDGEHEMYTGILSTVDGAVVENLTVRNYKDYGVYWISKETGEPISWYRGSYLTAHNIGTYAIYARNSEHGRFEHCYASGCDDAGYYIGESQPAHAVITDCIAEYNAMAYSGTNAGGDLVIKDSKFRNNMVGIVPNTLDSQVGAPQGHIDGGIRVENNYIHSNKRLDVPAYANAYAMYGSGVAIAGGQQNDIVNNTIEDHGKYGVVVFTMITETSPASLPLRILKGHLPLLSDPSFYPPKDNAVEDNEISDSGRADLALSTPAEGNVFSGNDVDSTRPMFLQNRDGSFGDFMVFLQILRDFMQTEVGSFPNGETENQPRSSPDEIRNDLEEYSLDDPTRAPRPPLGGMPNE